MSGAEPVIKTHWKQLTDPRFIGAYALPNGADLTVAINYVQKETITMMGGKKEDHLLMYLYDGWQPMILNATNGKTIEALYGPYIEDWAGQRVTLYASTTKMGGELVQCLRIRARVPQLDKETLTPARFTKALAGVRAGTFAAATLREKFALTDAQQAALHAAVAESAA